ncbi:uncharacterized protein VTP21DRAFT_1370 [Calcarisporiella thermophila]|uniref:uncharacterized protein n=1 Tax=Calcarisporiella thermophila TaxID=911321 RepID=UPI003743EAE0
MAASESAVVAVLVVGFHHNFGPIVEASFPPFPGQEPKTKLERLELPEAWHFLPFLALPDGAHRNEQDFTYFHLPPVPGWSIAEKTLFGIACNRQISSKDLLNRNAEVTRTTVQKAVVVLARQPVFSLIREKLAVVTAAWFAQRDFDQLEILSDLYSNFTTSLSANLPESALYSGTSLRELIHKFKHKVLVLFKLLLLEKKIMFYGHPVERLCTYQYSLVSLVPDLLGHLQDSGTPDLDTSEEYMKSISGEILKSNDKKSLRRYAGLPLHVFGKGCFFQPYLPLQQIELLQDPSTRSYLVGVTNSIFLQHRDCPIDVVVNVEDGTINFVNQALANILTPTAADKKFMNELVAVIEESWSDNEYQSNTMEYIGSDDFLRARFEEYLLSILASIRHAESLESENLEVITVTNEKNYLSDYNLNWVTTWKTTNNYQIWNRYADYEIYEICEPGHPYASNSSLSEFQRQFTNRLRDINFENNLAPIRESFSRAVSSGSNRVSRLVDTLWTELDHLIAEESSSKSVENNNNSNIDQSESQPQSSFFSNQQIPKVNIEATTRSISNFFTNMRRDFFQGQQHQRYP